MKKYVLVGLIFVLGLIAYLVLRKPKVENVSDFVRSKLNLSKNAKIEVKIEEGNYAYGLANEENTSGIYWGAAKIKGKWDYVFAGNGIPMCANVNIFPVGVLKNIETGKGQFDSCIDDDGNLVTRNGN